MPVPLAYFIVVCIWTTTPLATKWSGEGPGFLFAAAARVIIGVACVLILMQLRRSRFPVSRAALASYAISGASMFMALGGVYWAALRIPSGWISVIFGMTPLFTSLLAWQLLGERRPDAVRLLGLLLGLGGLAILFISGEALGQGAVLGVAVTTVSALLHSASVVLLKRINARLPALAATAGGLLVALLPFLLAWWLFDGHWPTAIEPRSLGAIIYLGVIGSGVGFVLFFYLLPRLSAARLALIMLITPVLALLLGHLANGEPLGLRIIAGSAMIVAALACHEFHPASLRALLARLRPPPAAPSEPSP